MILTCLSNWFFYFGHTVRHSLDYYSRDEQYKIYRNMHCRQLVRQLNFREARMHIIADNDEWYPCLLHTSKAILNLKCRHCRTTCEKVFNEICQNSLALCRRQTIDWRSINHRLSIALQTTRQQQPQMESRAIIINTLNMNDTRV